MEGKGLLKNHKSLKSMKTEDELKLNKKSAMTFQTKANQNVVKKRLRKGQARNLSSIEREERDKFEASIEEKR